MPQDKRATGEECQPPHAYVQATRERETGTQLCRERRPTATPPQPRSTSAQERASVLYQWVPFGGAPQQGVQRDRDAPWVERVQQKSGDTIQPLNVTVPVGGAGLAAVGKGSGSEFFVALLSCFCRFKMKIQGGLCSLGVDGARPARLPAVSMNGVAMNNANGAPRARCLVRLLHRSCQLTCLDHNCGQRASKFMLTSSGSADAAVNSRTRRVRIGCPSVAITISGRHGGTVQRLTNGAPPPRLIVLSSTCRRHEVAPSVGVLLISFGHPVRLSGFLPYKRLHRDTRGASHTSVVVMAGYPSSVLPISILAFHGRLGPVPCRDLCFSGVRCLSPVPTFKNRDFGVGGTGVLTLANVTRPGRFATRLHGFARRVDALSCSSRRGFDTSGVGRVIRQFGGLSPGRHTVVAARGSFTHLRGYGVPRSLGPCVCVVPVGVGFVFSSRSGFSAGVVGAIRGIVGGPQG